MSPFLRVDNFKAENASADTKAYFTWKGDGSMDENAKAAASGSGTPDANVNANRLPGTVRTLDNILGAIELDCARQTRTDLHC